MVATGIKLECSSTDIVSEEKEKREEIEVNNLEKQLKALNIPGEFKGGIEEMKNRISIDDLRSVSFRGETVEAMLQRYLQARKLDNDKTELLLRESLSWRKSYASKCVADGPAECLGCEVEEVLQFYPGAYAESPDKLGRPIWYERTGSVDSFALSTLTTNENFVRYHICLMEGLQDQYHKNMEVTGKYVNKTLSILDLRGFAVSMLTGEATEIIKMIAKTDSSYYPETMGAMFIINAPAVFSMAWSMIQGFLDPRTVSKISVCSTKEEWLPKLIELVGEENLPAELSGKGPACLPETPLYKEVSMSSSGIEKDIRQVKKGDKIKYKFFTRNAGNISFKVSFKTESGAELDLLPLRDYKADECSNGKFVEGTIEAPDNGTFISHFEHPGWWSRQLLFYIKVCQV